jgi:hypothetical protein
MRFVAGLLLAFGVAFAVVQADGEGEGGKNAQRVELLKEINEKEKTLTTKTGKRTTVFTLSDKLEIKIDGKDGKLADLKPGTAIAIKMSDDKKTLIGIEAGDKIRVGGGKPEGKEAPAPKKPEGKEAPAPKQPEGGEKKPVEKKPEGGEKKPAEKKPGGGEKNSFDD